MTQVQVKELVKTNNIYDLSYNELYNKINYYLSLNKNTTFYENIKSKCKPYADYDELYDEENNCYKNRNKIIRYITNTLKKKNIDFYLFDSSGYDQKKQKWKLSLHIIIDGIYVSSGIHSMIYIKKLLPKYKIDNNVYKKNGMNQLFRIPYTTKENLEIPRILKLVDVNTDEYKLIEFNDIDMIKWSRFFITNIENCKFVDIKIEEQKHKEQKVEIEEEEQEQEQEQEQVKVKVEEINDLLNIISLDNSYYNDYNKWLKVGLICSSLGGCFNQWDNFSAKSIEKYDQAEVIRVYNGLKGKKVYTIASLYYIAGDIDEDKTNDVRKKYNSNCNNNPVDKIKKILQKLEQNNNKIENNNKRLFQEQSEVEEYEQKYINPFNMDGIDTLFVKSAKGTGKSYQFENYIKKYNPEYCIFITFRNSLGRELLKRLKHLGFQYHNDIRKKEINIDNNIKRLTISAEALQSVCWKKCDCLILDEICSLEYQLFSKTTMKGKMINNINKFISLVKEAKKVICLDADLSVKQIKNINSIRQKPSKTIFNTYKTKTKSKINLYLDQQNMIDNIIKRVEKENIIIGTTRNKNFTETLKQLIINKYPNKKVLVINSITARRKIVSDIIKDVEDENLGWHNYNVVIYTPTIQAGVSFNRKHFSRFYGFFSNHMTVNATRQMTDRCREFSKNEYNYNISTIGSSSLPSNRKEFELYLSRRRNFNNSGIEIPEIIPYRETMAGNIIYPLKDQVYEMWLGLELQKIRDRNMFIYNFLKEEYRTGVKKIKVIDKKGGKNKKKKTNEISLEIKKKEIEHIVKAKQINEQEYNNIVKKIETLSDNITDDEMNAVKLYNIKDKYSLDQNTKLDIKAMNILQSPKNYTNLTNIKYLKNSIADENSIENGLKLIVERQKNKQEWNHSSNILKTLGIINENDFVIKGKFEGYEFDGTIANDVMEEFDIKDKFRCRITDLLNYRKYNCQCHITSHKLVRKFGFDNVMDFKKEIKLDDVKNKFENGGILSQNEINEIALLWGCEKRRIPKRKDMDFKNLMEFINGKIKQFYGITISKKNRKSNFMILKTNKNIDYNNATIII